MPPLRTALLQSSGQLGDVAANLKALDEAAARAAANGAGLLVAPEMFLTGYAIDADVHRLAEPADGEAADAVADIAERHGVAVAYGYPERDGDTVYNAAQLIGPDGTRLASYRKTHLYGDFELAWFTPGDRPVVQAELGGLRIGLMICYDVEFPENVRAHALAGTDLLLVPTALMHPSRRSSPGPWCRCAPSRTSSTSRTPTAPDRRAASSSSACPRSRVPTAPPGPARATARAGRRRRRPGAAAGLARGQPYLRDRRPALYTSLS